MNNKLVLLMAAAVMILTGCSVVGPGQRGIRFYFGTASETPAKPGPYIWIPFFLGISKMDVRVQKTEIHSGGGTKDLQDVHAQVAVNWSIAPDNVVNAWSRYGNEDDIEVNLIRPQIQEAMKAAISKRNADEVLTKRLEMKNDIDEGLKVRLAQFGIILNAVSVVDLKFSEGYTQAIEHKQIAEQQAQQAAYLAQKATQDAKAEVERAKGRAEAQRLIQQSTTPAILQQLAIEKWDGHFPQVMGQTALPFLNMKLQ